jgi:hypothetical protein
VAQSTGATEPRCGRLALCWRISKNCFVYMTNRGGVQGIQCSKAGQGGNLATWPSCVADQPDKWASHAHSSSRALPYPCYKYHGAPPADGVKKVRFRSPQGASKFNLCRVERGEVLRAGGLPGLSGVLRVAQAWKICRDPFGFDGVF